MKKVWLMGGFGNVLFQILAHNVISKTNKEVYYVNKLTKKNWFTRVLGWTVHQKLYKDLIKEEEYHTVGFFKSIIIVLVSFLSKKSKSHFHLATFYNESAPLRNNISNNIFGYFQDVVFLKNNKEELLKLGKKLNDKYAYESDLIVVHYRKGDSDCTIKFSYYYEKIRELLKKETKQILIVTDSINDANVFFDGIDNLKIISSHNALDDFKHLVSAIKLYCAPSTFSWWAAHSLGDNSEIIMPKMFKNDLGVFVEKTPLTFI